jgi:hypothetical protein
MMDDPAAEFITRYGAIGLTGTPARPEEVNALEQRLGIKLPAAYKAFLLICGRDGGPELTGTDCSIGNVPTLRKSAEELLQDCGSPFQLPENAVVFLMHQGYVFAYFVADGNTEDPAVFMYLEGDSGPVRKAESFSAWLEL